MEEVVSHFRLHDVKRRGRARCLTAIDEPELNEFPANGNNSRVVYRPPQESGQDGIFQTAQPVLFSISHDVDRFEPSTDADQKWIFDPDLRVDTQWTSAFPNSRFDYLVAVT